MQDSGWTPALLQYRERQRRGAPVERPHAWYSRLHSSAPCRPFPPAMPTWFSQPTSWTRLPSSQRKIWLCQTWEGTTHARRTRLVSHTSPGSKQHEYLTIAVRRGLRHCTIVAPGILTGRGDNQGPIGLALRRLTPPPFFLIFLFCAAPVASAL
jgi:hypothetical protein